MSFSSPQRPFLAVVLTVALSLVSGISAHAQSTPDFFLHGSGATANPPTLFLDRTAPTSTTEKYKDSASINFSGGDPWKEVGTWPADPTLTSGTLSALTDLHVWLGLKNSDDQGTNFDLLAEIYRNGMLVTSGLTRCITGVTINPNLAKEATVAFASFSAVTFNGTSDQLSLKAWTRIGTNPDNTKCAGHSNAVGLRLYFDATSRQARFGATFSAATSGPLTQARVSHTATLLPSGKVLLAGGAGPAGVLNTAELFDPVTLSATALTGTLTTARTEHTATLLPQTETLLVAGQDSHGLLFSTEMFNPANQTFRALSPNVQVLRSGHTATLLLDGRVLITGGQSSGALGTAEAFNAQTVVVFKPAYNPEAGTFTVLPNGLITPRWDHTATVLADGRILITGGQNGTGILASAEIFDPTTETFTALAATLTTPRAGHTATLLPDGRVLILGGQTAAGAVASAEVFSPSTNSFSAVTPGLTTARANHTATLLPTGTVLIAGGQNSSGILASTELYTPSPADTVAPVVNQVSPSSGATGVDLTEIIGVRFSEPVDVRTLTATSVTLTSGGAVAATISPGEQGLMVFVVPSAPLVAGTTYTLSLTAAIKDTSGHPLSAFTSQFTTVAAPAITGFTPASGPVGTAVTITGTNFDPVTSGNQVKFNGVLATVTAASATSLTALVPGGATTGPITVTTRGGTATSATNFTVAAPPPTITGFTPTQGKASTNVTLTGTNFDPTPANNQVKFNGVPAGVASATSTMLIATVPPTATSGPITVTTAGGTAQSATNFVVIPITAFSVTPGLATLPIGATQQVRAIATFADQTTMDVTSFTTWGSSNSNVASVTGGGLAQGAAQGTATVTGSLGTLSGSASVRVIAASGGPLPPDPTLVAPPVDRTVATTLGTATTFLYTGGNPVQTGVAPGTIIATRVAVLRGLVSGRDGFPIPGVTITVLGHPEFGQTGTRPDGMFDLAVNGGGLLTVKYDKAGYLSAQRQVNAPWQDYARLPDVVLTALDTQVTTVDLTQPVMQTARGSAVTDLNGMRQATVLFPSGTTAVMTLPGGTTQPLTSLSVRATEYTVGGTGPQAMPALLPTTSNYTYAVEFSVDQAQAANATNVQFSQPVISYLENFLGFPVGKTVPAGFYDRIAGQWAAAPSGRVIKILSVSGGLANVDTDGDGVADSGLGITTDERQRLASLYAAGTSLWRVPVDHFTTWDFNWILRLPLDAIAWALGLLAPDLDNCNCDPNRSLLRLQNQVLDESVAVAGTPFRLHHTSERVLGRRAGYNLTIPLSGATVPASLKRIEVDITVAGRRFTQTFSAAPNQQYVFPWDGTDAYGRLVQGRQLVNVQVGYVYNASYQENSRFAEIGGGGGSGGGVLSPPIVTGELSRFEVTVSRSSRVLVGPLDAKALGLGGWSLSVHHNYDTVGRKLSLGDGSRSSAESLKPIITTASAGANAFYVAVGPDGSLYFAENGQHRVRKQAPDGTITTVVGNGTGGFSGDGGPATAAQLNFPYGVAIGADGSLYISDTNNSRVRKVDPSGIITTFAGGSTCPGTFPCDGFPAPQGQLNSPRGLAMGPDGSLYIAVYNNGRIHRVGPDGIITTVAGGAGFGFNGDGIPATQAALNQPEDVAIGPDGSIYIADSFNFRVRRVTLDGIIHTYAGGGPSFGGDGLLATQVAINFPRGVAVGPDGSVYIGEQGQQSVRRVTPDGIITTVAGTGTAGFSGDGGPAPQATLNAPQGVAVGPDGSLYIADVTNVRIRKVAPALPGFVDATYVIPSADGSAVYAFNNVGKHLRTQDALTGAVKYQFAYDSNGLLASVTDVAGNVTTIARDGAGNPTAIVAPGGQRTALTVDGNGYLASITNPNSEATQVTSSADGLLATLTDPRSGVHQYAYDAQGRLTNDQDPAGGFTTLARTDTTAGWKVTSTTALNRTSTNQVTTLATGVQLRSDTDPSGLVTTTQIGNGTTTLTAPDGTVTTTIQGPDPRFNMQAPITSSLSVKLPSTLTSTLTTTRTAGLSNPNDPLSLTSQTDTLVINGRTYTSVFNQTAKTITTTTPAGRTSTVTLDAQGRVVQEQVTGLEAVSYTYDAQGRLSTVTQGTGANARTSTLSYDTKNQLTSVQDPLLRMVGFAYDLAGRITTQTLPDLRTIGYAYDANGNVTSITPPGKPAHAFSYTPVDLESNYDPPNAGFSPKNTQYTYNLDRQLTLVTRPDGQTLSLGYDGGGRLSTLTLPGNLVTTYAYDATKGTLTSITAPNSTLSYTYDGSLLLQTTWAGTVAGSVSRNYDVNFRIITQSVNGANTISFGYDNDSLLTSAGAETITRSAQSGLITGTTLGVVADSRSYSTFGELGQYTANVSGTPVLDVHYTRDKLGRITQKVETIGGVTDTFVYTYDTAGRLIDVNLNGATAGHYTYDSNGNRLSQTTSTGTVNGTYDAQDRLTNYGNLQLTYTTNGELRTKNNPPLGQTASFMYDVLGNLKSVSLPGSLLVEYVVDGQNRRVGKKVNGVLTQGFLYQNQLNPVAELDGTGNVVSRFVYGSKANVPDYLVKAGVTYRIVSDHLGSPRLVLDISTGAIAQRMDYDEFGNITVDTNPGFQPFGFAGGLYDQHTGLTRFGARDYDAQIGRWTAKDPIKFHGSSMNLYGYVLNDPVNLVDAKGLIIGQVIGGAIGAGFGAYAAYSNNPNASASEIVKSAAVGFAAGVLSTLPIPGVNPLLSGSVMGMVAGAAGNIGAQLLLPNSCSGGIEGIDWGSVGISALAGGIGGLAGGGVAGVTSSQGMQIFTQFGQDIISSSTAGIVAGVLDAYFQAGYQAEPQAVSP